VALEELRITVISPNHLVKVLEETFSTLSNTTNLSRIVLDADGRFSQEEGVDKVAWGILDGSLAEYADKVSAKHRNRRLTLQFRTEKDEATGEHDGWAKEFARLLVLFPEVGDVEYVSKQ
jgi:hypothetical protein